MDSELKIIKKYCGQIEERINACKSRDIAVLLMNRLCAELEQNCKNSNVMEYLQKHVSILITNYFDKNGNQKLMEKQ
ncbi:MAG TPA: hypothetical protein PLP19_13480 [bacterium]|nr:hypothetical protein [bacterium]HPN44499.1 hypothetical protein [bacterium]